MVIITSSPLGLALMDVEGEPLGVAEGEPLGEEDSLVDGEGVWGAFARIILPVALPGIVAAFILSLVLTWNEFFFASLLTSTDAKTLPVLVASQTGSQGISWWTMAAVSFAAILPLILVGIFL